MILTHRLNSKLLLKNIIQSQQALSLNSLTDTKINHFTSSQINIFTQKNKYYFYE